MRARMTVDARIVASDPEHPVKVFVAGQEVEGADAEQQVALGHAEAIAEASEGPAPEVSATPAAAAHAEELGVDLSTVEGTGAEGKITKGDVAAAASKDDGA